MNVLIKSTKLRPGGKRQLACQRDADQHNSTHCTQVRTSPCVAQLNLRSPATKACSTSPGSDHNAWPSLPSPRHLQLGHLGLARPSQLLRGVWWSPLGERATPCFSNQPLISQAKAKQRLRYLQRLGTSSIVSRTPKKSYQASHRPKQKRKQNKAGANYQTPSRIFTTKNKARVNPKFKQQCQPLIQ